MKYKIGIIGLGVMGRGLALNMERNGYPAAGYDLNPATTKAFLTSAAAGKNVLGVDSPAALLDALERPHRVLMLVPARAPVDETIAQLTPAMGLGDILIDSGNSHFLDTERRCQALSEQGIQYIGMGISGGESGALWGPSLMPGGSRQAWDAAAPIFEAIAARAEDGQPCAAYIGPRGAGHYVKMVHNGIEYADMQLIAEIYDILRRGLGLSASELHEIFAEWNAGELQSYLVEISAGIFRKVDEDSGLPLLDLILDEAGQKGTGKWASQNALDVGMPVPTINAAVESRILSSLKGQRVAASRILRGPGTAYHGSRRELIEAARAALYAGKILAYAQGFGLLEAGSAEYGYDLKLDEIASIWRAGCVIRASLLNDVTAAYRRNPSLANLLLDEFFQAALESRQAALRSVVQAAVGLGIPVLALNASLAYYDAYRSERLPANLTQAQRDFFGAHAYRRLDRDGRFHTRWEQPPEGAK